MPAIEDHAVAACAAALAQQKAAGIRKSLLFSVFEMFELLFGPLWILFMADMNTSLHLNNELDRIDSFLFIFLCIHLFITLLIYLFIYILFICLFIYIR